MPSRNWSHSVQGLFRLVHRQLLSSMCRFTNPHFSVERLGSTVRHASLHGFLPVSKRDPYAAGETRSQGCACVTQRSPACRIMPLLTTLPFSSRSLVQTSFNQSFIASVPDGFGNTLTKSQVVSSYRESLRKAGVLAT